MKNVTKRFLIIFIFIITPISFLYADSLISDKFEVELVGMPAPEDPSEKNNEKPTLDPDYVKRDGSGDEGEGDSAPGYNPIPKDPIIEYDPNNPYAEWEIE